MSWHKNVFVKSFRNEYLLCSESQKDIFLIEKAFSILSTGQLTYEHPVRPIGFATKVTPSYDPYENTQGGKNSLTKDFT